MRRNYRKEYDNYQSKPKQRRNNDKRKAARRLMEKEGKVSKGDGKDVGHKKPLAKGRLQQENQFKSGKQIKEQVIQAHQNSTDGVMSELMTPELAKRLRAHLQMSGSEPQRFWRKPSRQRRLRRHRTPTWGL